MRLNGLKRTVFLVLVPALFPFEALAEPAAEAPQKDAASAAFESAVSAHSVGDYETALEGFRSALELAPERSHVLFNIAETLRLLGRRAEATMAYERFLAEARDAPDDTRARASAYVAEFGAALGAVWIQSDFAEARIRVDGRRMDVSIPLKSPVRLEPGDHELVLEPPGKAPHVLAVHVATGDRRELVEFSTPLAIEPAPRPRVAPRLVSRDVTGPAAPGLLERPATWTTIASGGALALGVTFTVIREKRAREFNDTHGCGTKLSMKGAPGCRERYDEIHSAQALSTMGYGMAAMLAGVSAYLFFQETGSVAAPAPKSSFACAPALHREITCVAHF